MKRFAFKKIDAFATGHSSGNPAGCIYLQHKNDITSEEMLRIVQQLQGFVSEVAYLAPSAQQHVDFELTYYSAEREVDFCGHATIAIMYDVIKHDPILRQKTTITILTARKGQLAVENRLKTDDAVYITAPEPVFSPIAIPGSKIAAALRVPESALTGKYPLACVNAGLQTLLVPIRSLEEILHITPDFQELKTFCEQQDVDILTLFSDEVSHPQRQYRTRVFAPRFGYLEDPATGSGNAAFGYYLLQNGFWDGTPLILEQNKLKDRANIVRLSTNTDNQGIQRVLFGGGAVVRIEGEYILS
ncbi:phenazine biosynthesis protein PhzF family [Candidatus Vecturithrix granuli]|uniref:Phenazine biosynthesis protein PhzF family n=1 Tax=Vecturithrix granuli TaxID=1499967 RepID=A0A081BU61_VECG1|nr:phenazine biosynthesis protein PhzF family [Candidatus Vecturithrix granuli]